MAQPIDIPVPDLTGMRALVTGGSDGIGVHIAERLARAGAEVVLPVRTPAKGEAAADRIRARTTGAAVDLRTLDLASLASVRMLGEQLRAEGRPIHILIANAGVMTPPTRQVTVDGFELQLATNHLGHVALVAELLPLLVAGDAHVTTQLSVAADQHAVAWDDLDWEHGYHPMKAYSSSKILLGLWALELDRQSNQRGWGIRSNLSHPGVTPTNLLAAQPGMGRPKDTIGVRIIRALSRRNLIVGTPESAALPAIHAATSPDAAGGRFYGPNGFRHLRGAPAEQALYSSLTAPEDARRAWAVSNELVGATFPG